MFRHVQVKLTGHSLHDHSRSAPRLTSLRDRKNVFVQEHAMQSRAQEPWLNPSLGLLLCDLG